MAKNRSKPESEKEAARKRYVQEYPTFQASAKRARKLIKKTVREAGVPDAFIRVRAKEVSSFVKKLRKYPKDCWDRTTDKVGAQVVMKTLLDVRKLQSVLESGAEGMEYLETTKLATDLLEDPTSLRYSGVHIQVRLVDCHTTDGEPVECEIQLRTQSQDVWASLEHKLIYKPLVKPTPLVRRRIARLSVLVEMFDEEVDSALKVVMRDPSYADALIVRAAEALYLRFASEPGEPELSLEVISAISSIIPVEERDAYHETLAKFVDSHGPIIESIYRDFGLDSQFASQFDYFLFTQPESLVIFERLSSKPMALLDVIRNSDIEEPVRRLADAFGKPLPD